MGGEGLNVSSVEAARPSGERNAALVVFALTTSRPCRLASGSITLSGGSRDSQNKCVVDEGMSTYTFSNIGRGLFQVSSFTFHRRSLDDFGLPLSSLDLQ